MRMARCEFPSRLTTSSPERTTNIERPGSPSATTVAPASKRRSTSMETSSSRLPSGRPPKKGVATRNAFRSGELTAIAQYTSTATHGPSPEGPAGPNNDTPSFQAPAVKLQPLDDFIGHLALARPNQRVTSSTAAYSPPSTLHTRARPELQQGSHLYAK